MKEPKISVCIPVYNCEKYIGDAINSILNQTFRDFELIIIDNHSLDGTLDEIKKNTDERIKIILNPENIGLLNNWNKCLEASSGEYIKILCADDILESKSLERMIHEFEEDKTLGIVISNFDEIDCNNISTKKGISSNAVDYKILKGEDSVKDILKTNKISCCPSLFMVRKSVVKKLGLFEPLYNGNIYSSDLEFVIKVLYSFNGYFISDTLTKIRIHNEQSGFDYKREEVSFLSFYKECFDYIVRKYEINLNKVDKFLIDYKLAKSGLYNLAGKVNNKSFKNANVDLFFMLKNLNFLALVLAIIVGTPKTVIRKFKKSLHKNL